MVSKGECYEPDCGWLINKRLWFVIFPFIYDGVISYIRNLYVMNKEMLFHYFYNNNYNFLLEPRQETFNCIELTLVIHRIKVTRDADLGICRSHDIYSALFFLFKSFFIHILKFYFTFYLYTKYLQSLINALK